MWSKAFLLKCMFNWKEENGVLFGAFHRRASGWRCVFGVRFSHTQRKEMAVSRSSTSSAAVASILAREKSLMARPSAIFQDLSCRRNAKKTKTLQRIRRWLVWKSSLMQVLRLLQSGPFARGFFVKSNIKGEITAGLYEVVNAKLKQLIVCTKS